MERIQEESIVKDLNKKIVFIVGPRQVGKTWLAKNIAQKFENPVYLNYDRLEDRKMIQNEEWLISTDLVIFDEIHKMPGWKNYLKGVYDTKYENLKILVTGSARLDTFRQSGDSMAGRFFVHHLYPFSLSEISAVGAELSIELLLKRGGFPEPLLAETNQEANRWRSLLIDSLIRYDVLDFEKIHDFKAIQTVFELLRSRTGSPISYSSIARDVGIAPATVIKYIEIFESLYIIFRVRPYSKKISRSILKEPKFYFFDTGLVKGDDGIILENLVAMSLLKHLDRRNDLEGEHFELRYLRNKDGKEIDFCVSNEENIEKVYEVKWKDSRISHHLKYFCEKYNLPGIQLVKEIKREYQSGLIQARSCEQYLNEL